MYAWRRLYWRGLLDTPPHTAALLPVRITDAAAPPHPSSIEIKFAGARVHVKGAPEPATLRLVLESLLR